MIHNDHLYHIHYLPEFQSHQTSQILIYLHCPDFAHQLAQSIEYGSNELGIQFCGSGNGINMSANKHQAIRSALCWEVEIAELARLHNDANICTMPARFISFEKVLSIIDVFLNTDFEGGRHQRRVNKISC